MINVLSFTIIALLGIVAFSAILLFIFERKECDKCGELEGGEYTCYNTNDAWQDTLPDGRNIKIADWQLATNQERKSCRNQYKVDKVIKGEADCINAYLDRGRVGIVETSDAFFNMYNPCIWGTVASADDVA